MIHIFQQGKLHTILTVQYLASDSVTAPRRDSAPWLNGVQDTGRGLLFSTYNDSSYKIVRLHCAHTTQISEDKHEINRHSQVNFWKLWNLLSCKDPKEIYAIVRHWIFARQEACPLDSQKHGQLLSKSEDHIEFNWKRELTPGPISRWAGWGPRSELGSGS